MPAADADPVTVGIVNYNGREVLPRTVSSVLAQDHSVREIIVVDNGSTDGSPEWLRENVPAARCIRLETNIGLPAARNVILRHAGTELVLILDNDIVLEPGTLKGLVQAMGAVPDAGACHPEIRDEDNPGDSHYNGGSIHYLCAFIPKTGRRDDQSRYEVVDVVSGGALLLRRSAALRVDGFDGDYFFNWEDGDFTARLTLAGFHCLNVPSAIAWHRSRPRGLSKAFYMVRNRWFFILKLYSLRTILLAAPMLVLFELSQAGFLVLKGAGKEYVRGNAAVLRALPDILRKRRAFQELKIKRDKEWLSSGDIYMPTTVSGNRWLALVTRASRGLWDAYWRLIVPLC